MIKRFIKLVQIKAGVTEYREVIELDTPLKPIEDQIETVEIMTNRKVYIWVKFKNSLQHDPLNVGIDKFYIYNWTETHYKYFTQLLQKRLQQWLNPTSMRYIFVMVILYSNLESCLNILKGNVGVPQ
jgi:hypothetical protein